MIKIFLILMFVATNAFAAELIINVTDNGSFEDGDVIHAMNDRRIYDVHAQHICHIKKAPRNGKYIAPDTLAEDYLSNVMEYKFVRISKKEVKRINLATQEEEVLSDVPNEKGEYIHVQEFINRRLQSPNNQIFGHAGGEYWFGGRTNASLANLDKVWTKIEAKSKYKKADHARFPFTDKDKVKYAIIKTNDFTDEEQGKFESPQLSEPDKDGNQEVLKARKYKVNYKALNLDNVQSKDIITAK